MKDIFISHAWGNDELNRDNHERCKLLANKLINLGYSVWIDCNEIYGNIDNCIMNGINNCKIVLVCLTKKYCEKINKCVINQITNDNCYKEWNYSLFKKKIIIPVLMEPSMINIFLNHEGIIQMYLNSMMFIDFTINFELNFNKLCKYLQKNNIFCLNLKKKHISNSFNNFINLITKLPIKSISPRTLDKLQENYINSKLLINNYKINKSCKNLNKTTKIRTIIKI